MHELALRAGPVALLKFVGDREVASRPILQDTSMPSFWGGLAIEARCIAGAIPFQRIAVTNTRKTELSDEIELAID